MKFGLKWVHMAWYELILRQDGAIWLRIILKPPLAPTGSITDPNNRIASEMGPYGSILAHSKTGRSHMAQDHF